jgi:hypothetical protein
MKRISRFTALWFSCILLLTTVLLAPAILSASEHGAAPEGAPKTDPALLTFLHEADGAFYYQTVDGKVVVARRDGGTIAGVPDYDWWYGCTPTSTGMMMGFYDRNGFSNIVQGTAELDSFGGPAPNANAAIASSGHIADYWIGYGTEADPNPGSTRPDDSLADFMGTSKWAKCGSPDGSTWVYNWNDGHPWTPADAVAYGVAGCELISGIDRYVTSRGYPYEDLKSQYISAIGALGMTLAQFQTEIDAARPVGVNIEGHTMMGYGYSGSTIYVNDTWSSPVHTMPWGGSYSGSPHYGCFTLTLPPWEPAYAAMDLGADAVAAFRAYRDEVLTQDVSGQLYTRFLYSNGDDALEVLHESPELQARLSEILAQNADGVHEVLAGGTGVIYDAEEVMAFLTDYARNAPWRLRILAIAVNWELQRAQRTGEPFLGFEVR